MVEQCEICGYAKILQVHHIVPKRFGGTDIDDNLKTLCPLCHRTQHYKIRHNKNYFLETSYETLEGKTIVVRPQIECAKFPKCQRRLEGNVFQLGENFYLGCIGEEFCEEGGRHDR